MNTTSSQWTSVRLLLPPEGVAVQTKVDDAKGCRNEQRLVLKHGLWFFPDLSMYVYYTPTHWRPLP